MERAPAPGRRARPEPSHPAHPFQPPSTTNSSAASVASLRAQGVFGGLVCGGQAHVPCCCRGLHRCPSAARGRRRAPAAPHSCRESAHCRVPVSTPRALPEFHLRIEASGTYGGGRLRPVKRLGGAAIVDASAKHWAV